jgi:hypothetical protein
VKLFELITISPSVNDIETQSKRLSADDTEITGPVEVTDTRGQHWEMPRMSSRGNIS